MSKCDHGGQPWYECDCRFVGAEPVADAAIRRIDNMLTVEAQPPVECADKVKSKAVVYIRELADGSIYLSGGGHGKAAEVASRMQEAELLSKEGNDE